MTLESEIAKILYENGVRPSLQDLDYAKANEKAAIYARNDAKVKKLANAIAEYLRKEGGG
jgi:hypothetical protein